MQTPDLISKVDGVYPVTLRVAAMRDDASLVLAARDFVPSASSAGNAGGASTEARALSVYFWSIGQREQSEYYASYGADAS